MFSSNRCSRAARLFVLLALLSVAFSPVFAQETATPAVPPAAALATAPAAAAPADLSFYEDAPAADKAAVAASRTLTESGKWLSAWKILAAYDASNVNPWILAEKIRSWRVEVIEPLIQMRRDVNTGKTSTETLLARVSDGEGKRRFDEIRNPFRGSRARPASTWTEAVIPTARELKVSATP